MAFFHFNLSRRVIGNFLFLYDRDYQTSIFLPSLYTLPTVFSVSK
jgi:hypothetical protein